MAEIAVKWDECLKCSNQLEYYAKKLGQFQTDLPSLRFDSCFQIEAQEIIKKNLQNTIKELNRCTTGLQNIQNTLEKVSVRYSSTETKISNGEFGTDIISSAKDVLFTSDNSLRNMAEVATGVLGTSSSALYFLNDDISKERGKIGITEYLGKFSSEAGNEFAQGEVNAYIGKAEVEAKADACIMRTKQTKKYKDGKWKEEEIFELLAIEGMVGAGISALSADAKGNLGDDKLGLEGEGSLDIGKFETKAKGKFSVGEDGVNLYADASVVVSAVEGKAKGTLNIFGLEISLEAKGYAGAVGAEGKIGVEDGVFVLEAGAAALIGGSLGIEIGFNDFGWDSIIEDANNFVDFLTFWD